MTGSRACNRRSSHVCPHDRAVLRPQNTPQALECKQYYCSPSARCSRVASRKLRVSRFAAISRISVQVLSGAMPFRCKVLFSDLLRLPTSLIEVSKLESILICVELGSRELVASPSAKISRGGYFCFPREPVSNQRGGWGGRIFAFWSCFPTCSCLRT